jgi:ATP-binding protein involved in chromosome partitioning
VAVHWPDGTQSKIANTVLRGACRCAICINEFTGEQKLRPKDISPDIRATEIKPLGHYALHISWSDGHSVGIFPYDQLRALAASD